MKKNLVVQLVNIDFGTSLADEKSVNTVDSSGSPIDYTVQNCSTAPTQCEDNGHTNAICITRQNPDEGVICAENCSTGYQKAGTFNHTCVACSTGTYNPSWNQYHCQSWSGCSSGQKSMPGQKVSVLQLSSVATAQIYLLVSCIGGRGLLVLRS